ncbi:MAG: ABC transporter permease [Lachnoclostridium sp.]|jgi:peptide/nickel transport system permease protein|nr:ABC transporter permease [Lachnoclostridium sp.]
MSRKIGYCLLAVLLLVSIIGLFWTPYPPDEMNIILKNAAPDYLHPFGCDHFGRDIFSRVMAGLSSSIQISASVVAIGSVFGSVIGAITGYFGGWLDEIIMRINDSLTAFPSIFLALIFVAVFGTGKFNIILVLGILFIPSFARIMRSEYVKQRGFDYVKNARVMGAGTVSILFRHMLPNMKAALIPCIVIGFNNAMLAEAGMSYLGLGVQPPEASLGRMISESSGYLVLTPWAAIFPGLVMALVIYAVGLAGEKGEAP